MDRSGGCRSRPRPGRLGHASRPRRWCLGRRLRGDPGLVSSGTHHSQDGRLYRAFIAPLLRLYCAFVLAIVSVAGESLGLWEVGAAGGWLPQTGGAAAGEMGARGMGRSPRPSRGVLAGISRRSLRSRQAADPAAPPTDSCWSTPPRRSLQALRPGCRPHASHLFLPPVEAGDSWLPAGGSSGASVACRSRIQAARGDEARLSVAAKDVIDRWTQMTYIIAVGPIIDESRALW